MEAGELDISSPSEMTKVSVAVRVRPLIERETKSDANEKLENERALRDEKAKETELEHQEMEEGLQAIIESKMTELRERDEQIKQLQSSLQDKSQERCNLDSDLLEAEKLINSLKSAKLQLDGELAAQQSACKAIELVVQKLRQDLASVQEKQDLERQDKEENIRKLNLITKEHENCQNWAEDRKTLENQNNHLITKLAELREEVQQRLSIIEKTDVETQAFSLSIEEMKDKLVLISSEAEAQRLKKEDTIERMDRIAHDHDHCEDHITQLKISLEQQDRIIADKLTVEAELKLTQAAYDEAKSLTQKMSEKLEEMENKWQEDLSLELVEAQSLINSLESAKVELEEELVAQQNAYETIKISAQKMQQDLALLQEKRAVEIQENNEKTQKLDMISKEHESCQNLGEDLKMMENHIQQLMTEKAELEQRLKEQEAVIEKAEAESQAFNLSVQEMKDELVLIKGKEETLRREKEETTEKMNLVLQEHDKCQDLVIELKTTRDQLDKIIVDKLGLEEQLKSQQEAYDEAESVVLKMSEKLETMEENYKAGLKVKDDKVERMTAILKEHENCQDLSKELQTTRDQLETIIADKVTVEKQLKAQHNDYENAQSIIEKMKKELATMQASAVAEQHDKEKSIKNFNRTTKRLKAQHDAYEACQLAIQKMKEDNRAVNADWEIRFEDQRVAYHEDLASVQNHTQEVLHDASVTIQRLNAVIQDVSVKYTSLSEQFDEIKTDKIASESRLNMDRTALASVMESIKRMEAELYDKEQEIKQLNKIVEEHGSCQEKEANYLLDQTLLESLKADKVKLKEQLKAQQDAYEAAELSIQTMKQELSMKQLEIKERDMNIDKLNRVLEDHENCDAVYSDLHTARMTVENLLVAKEELEERLKSFENSYEKAQSTARLLKVELDNVQDPGKPGRGVVVTRGTQCDDIASELDQYKDATKHYRNRAHKAEFELQRVQKALGQKDEDTQSPEPRRAPIPPPPPPKPQRSGVTTSSKVETGVQCTLLNELIGQSTKSELGGLSVCIPELAQLHGDLKLTKIALDNAKLELAKYTSKSKPQSVIGAGKPTENVAKYNKPSGFQKIMACFQGGSTRMNTKEGVILPGNQPRVPKDLQPGPVEEKVETKICHVSPKDLEDIENSPEPIQATPAEEEPEDDFSWLMQLVKKKT
ncbi:unnamed protein product [Orchesella dallaii]|uniref:Uncharacterized protein n=1 Tax=Orchesella dallaii TaxID=48710 RepID=A0ABP1PYA6_9HEXA